MNYTLDSLFGVKDEVIVVCGGTRGIGREIANGLADLGAKLASIQIIRYCTVKIQL